jgi:hypothetical protein
VRALLSFFRQRVKNNESWGAVIPLKQFFIYN